MVSCNQLVDLCVQPTEVQSKIREFFKPLKLPIVLNAYPSKFFEYFSMFNGNDHVTVKKHMEAFEKFIDDFEIVSEDVVILFFCKSLVRYAVLWFKKLEVGSIGLWVDFGHIFIIGVS